MECIKNKKSLKKRGKKNSSKSPAEKQMDSAFVVASSLQPGWSGARWARFGRRVVTQLLMQLGWTAAPAPLPALLCMRKPSGGSTLGAAAGRMSLCSRTACGPSAPQPHSRGFAAHGRAGSRILSSLFWQNSSRNNHYLLLLGWVFFLIT